MPSILSHSFYTLSYMLSTLVLESMKGVHQRIDRYTSYIVQEWSVFLQIVHHTLATAKTVHPQKERKEKQD